MVITVASGIEGDRIHLRTFRSACEAMSNVRKTGIVSAALANVDPAMEEAAANLGCHGWGVIRRLDGTVIKQ